MSKNIKVAIRVRPLLSKEEHENLNVQWVVNKNAIYPIDSTTGKKNGDSYSFDHIFDCAHNNFDIYSTVVQPVVSATIDGFNGTIFAYGQTSSGKTYTMIGNDREPGLISLAVDSIFSSIELSSNRKFLLRVSYIEIYNEKIHDLLNIENVVKIHEDHNGSVIVNVKEVVTDTAAKVHSIMRKGDKARKIGVTNMNEKSSRSHTIFRIIIESSDENDRNNIVNVSQLNLVDLAGSERAAQTRATGMRFKEGAHINKSLSALGLVMKQLSESQDFINFRDSKLTRLLQSSLGGNALTAVICTVTLAALDETHSTLMFASRAKSVKNKPRLNEIISDEALISKYATQIDKLKKELEKANAFNKNLQVDQNKQTAINTRLKERITLLEKSVLHSADRDSSTTPRNSRRMTWCAPASHRLQTTDLPVIFEHDILQLPITYEIKTPDYNKSILDFDNFDSQEIPLDECELALIENEKFCRRKDSCDEDVFEVENYIEVKSESWFRHSNESADASESISTSLATNLSEELGEYEYLKIAYKNLKDDLQNAKTMKLQIQDSYEQEKRVLTEEMDELKYTNQNLMLTLQEVQKSSQEANDNACLAEMYKERYTRREKELLDLLNESKQESIENDSLDNLPNFTENVSEDTKFLMKNIREHLNTILREIQAGQMCPNNIKTLIDNICAKKEHSIIEDSDEIQDLFDNILLLLDMCNIFISFEKSIADLENEKIKLLNTITNLQLKHNLHDSVIIAKDKEVKVLTDKNIEYEWLKAELENKLLNMSEKEEVYKKNVTKMTASLQQKDREIEELSEQILDYVYQLSACENELKYLKSISDKNQSVSNQINIIVTEDDVLTDVNTNTTVQLKQDMEKMSFQMQNVLEHIKRFSEILTNQPYMCCTEDESNNASQIIQSECDNLEMSQKLFKQIMDCENVIRDCEHKLNQSKSASKLDKIAPTENDENICRKVEDLFIRNMCYIAEAGLPDGILKEINYNNQDQFERTTEQIVQFKEETQLKNKLLNMVKQISDYKSKHDQYSIIFKINQEIQTDFSESLDIIEKDETISKFAKDIELYEEKLLASEKNMNIIITEKNKEINDLSNQIKDHIDVVAACREELKECKLKLESQIRDDNVLYIKEKSTEIDTLYDKISEYKSDRLMYGNTLNTYKIISLANRTPVEDVIEQNEKATAALHNKILEYDNQLSAFKQLLEKCKNFINSINISHVDINEHLTVAKQTNKTIEALSIEITTDIFKLLQQENERRAIVMHEQTTQTDINDDPNLLCNSATISAIKRKVDFIMADLDETLEDKIFQINEKIENIAYKLTVQNTETQKLNSKLVDEIRNTKVGMDDLLAKNLILERENKNMLNEKDKFKEYSSQMAENLSKLNDQVRIKQAAIEELLVAKSVLDNEKVVLLCQLENEIQNTENQKKLYMEFSSQMMEKNEEYKKRIEIVSAELNNSNAILKEKCTENQNLQLKLDNSIQEIEKGIKMTETESEKYLKTNKKLEILLNAANDQNILLKQQLTIVNELTFNCSPCRELKKLHEDEIIKGNIALQMYKENLNKLEVEKKLYLEENAKILKKSDQCLKNLEIRNIEIKDLNNKLNNRVEEVEKLQLEINNLKQSSTVEHITVNNLEQNLAFTTEELNKLKHSYENQKKTTERIVQKTNTKILTYKNFINKLKADHEKLKISKTFSEPTQPDNSEQILLLRNELEHYKTEAYNNSVDLQKKIVTLETEVEESNKLSTYLRNLTSQQACELKHFRKQLHDTNEHLQDALKQLAEEKNSSFEIAQKLEESLEEAKYELHELKHKDKVRYTKTRRQHLVDSSRNITTDIADSSPELHSYPPNCKCEALAAELADCKAKLATMDQQSKTEPNGAHTQSVNKPPCLEMSGAISGIVTNYNFETLQYEFRSLKQKYEGLKELCKFRKLKILDLESQLKNS